MIDELMVVLWWIENNKFQLSDGGGALTKLGKSLDEKFSPGLRTIICIILFL